MCCLYSLSQSTNFINLDGLGMDEKAEKPSNKDYLF